MALQIRKIETKEESERKQKRNTLILSIIMISILVFSTAGYFSIRDDNSGTKNSNGDNGVQNIGNYWVFNYQGNNIRLSNSPESTQNVSVVMFKRINDYAGKTIYVASDYDSSLYEISSTIGNYVERIQPACYGSCDKNLPEKNCSDTMIVIKKLNETDAKSKVYEQENCAFIEGDLKAVDAFLYRIFGVR